MAFYEMLPGAGMPSGLQAGMDSVLNKKFGTSTTYPAEGWPDNVNLMGPLPEKTVSGAIVTFSDGADAVPLKKCEITLPASLDGYSSADVNQCDTSIVSITDFVQGSMNSYGAPQASVTRLRSNRYSVEANKKYLFQVPAGFYIYEIHEFTTDETFIKYTTVNASSFVLTTSATTGKIAWLIRTPNNAVIVPSDVQYAYNAPATTYTADLGRTIYGGTADVVNGTAKPTNLLDETAFETYSNWRTDIAPSGSYPTGNANRGFELQVEAGVTYAVSFGMDSETYPTYLYLCRTNGVDSERLIYFSGANFSVDNGTFTAESGWTYYFRLGSTGTEADFNGQIAKLTFEQVEKGATVTPHSPYFAPFTFDPVPIDSKLGNNTLWSEQGSAEVTYRADIALALGE